MKKIICLSLIIATTIVFAACQKDLVEQELPDLKKATIEKSNGFDEYGYNWHAHTFNGFLVNMVLGSNYFRDVYPMPHYRNHLYSGMDGETFWNMLTGTYPYFPFLMPSELIDCRVHSQWNDALIAKDGTYPPMTDGTVWVDTNAWIVFKYSGVKDGKKWSHMRKLVAIQSSYELHDGKWFDENGNEIGLFSKYWSTDLIVIQSVNIGDVNTTIFYEEYISPSGAGLGKIKK